MVSNTVVLFEAHSTVTLTGISGAGSSTSETGLTHWTLPVKIAGTEESSQRLFGRSSVMNVGALSSASGMQLLSLSQSEDWLPFEQASEVNPSSRTS